MRVYVPTGGRFWGNISSANLTAHGLKNFERGDRLTTVGLGRSSNGAPQPSLYFGCLEARRRFDFGGLTADCSAADLGANEGLLLGGDADEAQTLRGASAIGEGLVGPGL